jgi:hypothetical protein
VLSGQQGGRAGFLTAGCALLLAACAPAARFVVVEPAGGAVAIQRNTPEQREKALALMAQKCPRGYDIVREEEVVTGETVTTEYDTEFNPAFKEVRTTEQQRTHRSLEWRITFTCR